jgi:hypothetical protein
MMKPGIRMTKVWFDDDMVELKIEVSDGTSLFSTKVYVGHAALEDTVRDLAQFRNAVHGGIYDMRFGEFGPEYASGAFAARLHFARPGRLYITCNLESDYVEFSENKVASRATLYLKTEPVLLDNFIAEMRSISGRKREDASLEAIGENN